MKITTVVRFKFDSGSAADPMICYLAKDYDLVFSLLQADVKPGKGGRCILKLEGEEEAIRKGLAYAASCQVDVRILTKSINWDEETCVHCGACTAVCAAGALTMDKETALLNFDNEKCVVCELCVDACLTKALHADFA